MWRARSQYSTGSGPSGSAADLGDRASSGASGARDASEETPAWRATWTSLRVHGAARTSCARGIVVHYGPRTSGRGCQLGRTEEVIRHYGLWPPGLASRLGERGRLRRSRSPRRQLEKLQLGGPQDLAASPRGVAHVVCRARSQYSTGSGPWVQLPTWGTGPAPAHPEPKTLTGRLQLESLQGSGVCHSFVERAADTKW